MGEFKPIETQEQFNAMLKDRLERHEASIRKEYEGYLSHEQVQEQYKDYDAMKSQIESFGKEREQFNSQLEKYKDIDALLVEKDNEISSLRNREMKINVAIKNGMDLKLADRLQGSTVEELQEDFNSNWSSFVRPKVAPSRNGEHKLSNNESPYQSLLKGLKGE